MTFYYTHSKPKIVQGYIGLGIDFNGEPAIHLRTSEQLRASHIYNAYKQRKKFEGNIGTFLRGAGK